MWYAQGEFLRCLSRHRVKSRAFFGLLTDPPTALIAVASGRRRAGDQESRRVKFVGITFVGENVGGMQRGRVGAHSGPVKQLFGVSVDGDVGGDVRGVRVSRGGGGDGGDGDSWDGGGGGGRVGAHSGPVKQPFGVSGGEWG